MFITNLLARAVQDIKIEHDGVAPARFFDVAYLPDATCDSVGGNDLMALVKNLWNNTRSDSSAACLKNLGMAKLLLNDPGSNGSTAWMGDLDTTNLVYAALNGLGHNLPADVVEGYVTISMTLDGTGSVILPNRTIK